jgi:hypothetical protein
VNYFNGLHVGSRSRRQCCSLAVRSGKGYRPRMACHFFTGFEPQLNILREDSPVTGSVFCMSCKYTECRRSPLTLGAPGRRFTPSVLSIPAPNKCKSQRLQIQPPYSAISPSSLALTVTRKNFKTARHKMKISNNKTTDFF